jgi:hypothetical protein
VGLLSIEPEVDQEGGGAAVVTDEIGQEHTDDVGVEAEHDSTGNYYSSDWRLVGAGREGIASQA